MASLVGHLVNYLAEHADDKLFGGHGAYSSWTSAISERTLSVTFFSTSTKAYYHCNGVRQPTPVCDITHSFHVDAIDDAVWQWVKDMLQNPEKVILGMRGMKREAEQASLREHPDAVIPSDEQIASVEAMCAEIRVGLENATFEDKKRYFEILDVRGAVAYEDGKEVIYTTCRLGKQQGLQTQTSPWRCDMKDNALILTARLVI